MSASIASKARSLPSRTLHLKVFPTPRTFAEQREVLRVIERFGEVSVFKSLKYDPQRPVHDAFLAVYNSESSAQGLENVSPLRYRLIHESSTPSPADSPEDDASNSTVFELRASKTKYNHHAFLNSPRLNPLHGPDDILAPDEEMRTGKDGESISEGWFSARDVSRRTDIQKPVVMLGLQALWKERTENKERKIASMGSFEHGTVKGDSKSV
ncbi:hypothetical protein ACEPPN_009448 [Leptodophora sp. 'Broadleaf-Isolate-01']